MPAEFPAGDWGLAVEGIGQRGGAEVAGQVALVQDLDPADMLPQLGLHHFPDTCVPEACTCDGRFRAWWGIYLYLRQLNYDLRGLPAELPETRWWRCLPTHEEGAALTTGTSNANLFMSSPRKLTVSCLRI